MRPARITFSFSLISLICFISGGVSISKPQVNREAEAFAKVIPTFKPGGNTGSAAKQMTQLITILAASKRNTSSSNAALINKAMDFREDIGPQQKSQTVGAVLKAWEAAYYAGALNGKRFTGNITKGRYEGERLVFENIVPPGELPQAAGYIGNLRLVPASLARKKGDPLNTRDQAYANGLKQVIHESKSRVAMLDIQKSKVEEFGHAGAMHEEKWQGEVNQTGDAYKQEPNIQIVAQRQSSPSKLNGNTYSLRVEVTNLSRHPTEVEIESALIGYTEKNNRIYDLKREKRVLKLRRSQVHEYVIVSPNVAPFMTALQAIDPMKVPKSKKKGKKPKIPKQPVIYRGYTAVARFNGNMVASTSSDGRMAKIVSGEYSAPAKVLK